MSKKIKILVSNDDGIDSPGIFALAEAMKTIGEVCVVAPNKQQSAVAHAMTVTTPLRATPFYKNGTFFGYAINGTPADSVKLGLCSILDELPDLVITGINHGLNTSVNMIYSGTVAAATEGMLRNIPSIAFSLSSYDTAVDCSAAAEFSTTITKKILQTGLPTGTLLNVNIPAVSKDKIKGIKITRQSNAFWNDSFEKRQDPFGRDYFWYDGTFEIPDNDINSDDGAVKNNYISITPIHYCFTNTNFINILESEFQVY